MSELLCARRERNKSIHVPIIRYIVEELDSRVTRARSLLYKRAHAEGEDLGLFFVPTVNLTRANRW